MECNDSTLQMDKRSIASSTIINSLDNLSLKYDNGKCTNTCAGKFQVTYQYHNFFGKTTNDKSCVPLLPLVLLRRRDSKQITWIFCPPNHYLIFPDCWFECKKWQAYSISTDVTKDFLKIFDVMINRGANTASLVYIALCFLF